MKHIFISAPPSASRAVNQMHENLRSIGYRPWIDPHPRPNMDWRFEIDDAIRAADAVIVIVTPHAAKSIYVTYEWSLALGFGIPVIPVIFQRAEMHPRLQMLEHYDYSAYTEPYQFWDYFKRELRRKLDVVPQPQLVAQNPPNPAPVQASPAANPVEYPAYTRSFMPTVPGFWIVVRRGPKLNEMFRLAKDTITLGRDDDNDITLDDPEVSRRHLRFLWRETHFAVEDLNSTNGTRLNGGARIQGSVDLTDGVTLHLGDGVILSYEEVPRAD